ncbi:MAG TPA: MgtC/SapB family protein [Vicinamibacterales bacterium]|nr:MgtC/SapB family protein [Vicinamibacterales bacterium]
MSRATRARFTKYGAILGLLVILAAAATAVYAAQPGAQSFPPAQQAERVDIPGVMDNLQEEMFAAVVRLPIAAALGAVLALRPRRRGTPIRQPAVVQTQIILSVVGALIMLVVGSSLARAFGIVGAANLIRYRSKIDDPKDAVVMLCALSVGLAAGVGLYGLSIFGTLFLTLALWVIEGFEPPPRVFELSVKLGEKTATLRPRVESILRRFKADYEMRGSSEEEVSYLVTVPTALQTDRVSNALTALVASGKGAVEWKETKVTKGKV